MKRFGLLLLLFAFCPHNLCAQSAGESKTAANDAFFRERVQPILEKNCLRCHSHAAGKSKGNLMLDSRGALLKGGESGPAIVVGHPEKSLLIHAVSYGKDDLRMPPTGQLPAEEVAVLRTWIERGAPWPAGDKKAVAAKSGAFTAEDRAYWAFQPVKAVVVPEVSVAAWAASPIDRFILARLHGEGLEPAPQADRRTLIRRLFFDLTGLPPSPADVDHFLADQSADAYEKLVDRLLASPRYGEHWARHWLDLVRYAESDGYRADAFRQSAWRYRDYVIRAFNRDKPYDRFLAEQLAGDELYPDDPDALVATGFLSLGIYEHNQRDVRGQWQDMLNDITDVTAETFLGLGMGCARCHDHKFDAILQKDYFRLQAFFAGILPDDQHVLASKEERAVFESKLARWQEQAAPILAKLHAFEEPEKKRAETSAILKFPPDIQAMMRKPVEQRDPLEKQLAALAYRQVQQEFDVLANRLKTDKRPEVRKLLEELARLEALKPASLPVGRIVRDVGPEAPPVHLPKKIKGPAVEPGILSILDNRPMALTSGAATSARRTSLARWLGQGDNPLSTRVIVNRIWQRHFGQGLVRTSSDFGRLGDRPTHPELLDWLARKFVEDGWSFKKLDRLIVTSMTYKQSATTPLTEAAARKDPENLLYHRRMPRRLQAEQIRDALLAVAGKLDLTTGGPSVDTTVPRRTIYTKTLRNKRHALLEVFDAPEGIASTGQRNTTTTPTQALLMINGPFVLQQARHLAERLDGEADESAKIRVAFRLALGRAPLPIEIGLAHDFLAKQAGQAHGKDRQRAALVDFCHVLLNANEFIYVD